MVYIVIFKRLAGIPNVALLVRPMVHYSFILCIVYLERLTRVNLENGVQLLLTLNGHNCFITLIYLKHFLKPRKDRYIFLLNVYFVQIKNEQTYI